MTFLLFDFLIYRIKKCFPVRTIEAQRDLLAMDGNMQHSG